MLDCSALTRRVMSRSSAAFGSVWDLKNREGRRLRVDESDVRNFINMLLPAAGAAGAIAVVVAQVLSTHYGRRSRDGAAQPLTAEMRLELVSVAICLGLSVLSVILLLACPAVVIMLYYAGYLGVGATASWLLWSYVVGVVPLALSIVRIMVPGWVARLEIP